MKIQEWEAIYMEKFRPMLACAAPKGMEPSKFYEELRYPVMATPKLDGIRCVTMPPMTPGDYAEFGVKTLNNPCTRYLKPVPNKSMRTLLAMNLPPWLDGELVAAGTFQNCQSAVMSQSGTWDFKYYVFDVIPHDLILRCFGIVSPLMLTYAMRTEYLKCLTLPDWCVKLVPERIERGHLENYVDKCLADKYEGSIIRTPSSPYKRGRSTFREQWMVKCKQFIDAEAAVIGYIEEYHNGNQAERDALGYQKRSSHAENMVGKGRLGALRVSHPEFGDFNIGSGFTASERESLWGERDSLRGRVVTFRFQPQGMKTAPRCPIFKAFRDHRDMDADQGNLL